MAMAEGSSRRYDAYEYEYHTVWDSSASAWMSQVAEYPEMVGHGKTMQDAFYSVTDKMKVMLGELYEHGGEPITPNRYLDLRAL